MTLLCSVQNFKLIGQKKFQFEMDFRWNSKCWNNPSAIHVSINVYNSIKYNKSIITRVYTCEFRAAWIFINIWAMFQY